MSNWASFPRIEITPSRSLTRIHSATRHPGYFNPSSEWRFGPPPSRVDRFGVCYLGLDDPMAAYVEKYGRFGVITQTQITNDAYSVVHVATTIEVADVTNRSVLGAFGITAAHSTGADYGPSQALAEKLFDRGFGGIRYRIRHDPALTLEAIALFGAPGEDPSRFAPPKTTTPLPVWLIDSGSEFGIIEAPTAPLP